MGAFGYPVALEVHGRQCVVIGSGRIARERARALAAAGATVTELGNGKWRPEDLDGALLCVATSRDPAERNAIAREARARHVLVNVIDDSANCDFAVPAVVRRGHLQIAISTGGAAPALARRIREELEERFGPEWEEIVRILGDVRASTTAGLPDFAERSSLWAEALDPAEAEALVRAGRGEELRARLLARLRRGAA